MGKARKLRQYGHDSLVKAVEAVERGEMSIRAARKRYNVPNATISDKIRGRSDLDTKISREGSQLFRRLLSTELCTMF
jgi:transposase